jgi:GT2 family glycosyltransferase
MPMKARQIVRAGGALAALGSAHAVLNTVLLRRPDRSAEPATHASILIPARDEADRIGACVAAAMTQGVEVLVLDDGSTDRTAAIATEAGATVHTGGPLPPGWLGKPHACAQLAVVSDPASTALVFLDADVILAPHALAAALDLLDRTGLDILSPYPRQLAGSFLERLVQPLLQWSIFTFVPLRVAERSRHESLAVANGQFLVVRREAYERAGGHAAIRAEVLDDLALARAVRRAGGSGGVVDGTDLATCRMYRDARELHDGYAKSLWQAFGSPAGATAVAAALALAYVVPPLAAVAGSRAGLAGYLAAVFGRVVVARRTGARCWPDAMAHPFSIIAVTALTTRSHRLHRRGALTWKSRPLPRVSPGAGRGDLPGDAR